MILKVITNAKESIATDSFDYEIKPEMLKMNGTHVFIASRMWDKIVIELTDDIPLGSLKHIREKTKELETIIPPTVNQHIVQLCTELYPDKAGTIRKNFLMKGEIPSGVLC